MSDEQKNTLEIPLEVLDERRMLGLCTEWMSGEDADTGTEVEVLSSAGFGGGWFALRVTLPDGRHRTEIANLTPLVAAWAERVVKDMGES